MQVNKRHIRIARVLHEDDDFLTLEVVKNEERPLRVEDGDKYLTLMFTKHDPEDNSMEVWIPWDAQ